MKAIIKFVDGESLPIETEGAVPDRLTFPVRPAPGSNNRLIYASMSQIKYIVFPDLHFDRGDTEDPREAQGHEKIVIHFSDGETMRCFKDESFSAENESFNVRLWNPSSGHLVRAMVSMHSIKAIFVVDRWDSRELATGPAGIAQAPSHPPA